MKKKQMYIRNGIVFDPNIPYDPFGFSDSEESRTIYRKGKTKRKKYFGI